VEGGGFYFLFTFIGVFMANTTTPLTGYTFGSAKQTNSVVTWSLASSSYNPTIADLSSSSDVTGSNFVIGPSVPAFSNYITDSSYISAIQQALATWSKATGLQFQQVPVNSTANIVFGWADLPSPVIGNTAGITASQKIIQLEDPAQHPIVNTASGQLGYSGDKGQSFETIILHEIGHALGLIIIIMFLLLCIPRLPRRHLVPLIWLERGRFTASQR
jgi:hypothetical protein